MEVNVVLIDDNHITLGHLVDYLDQVKEVECGDDVITFKFDAFPPGYSREDRNKVDLDATLRKVRALNPGVAVIDLKLEGHAKDDYSGADLSLRIKAACNDCCIILVSHHFAEAPRVLDNLEIFRFRVDRSQAGYGEELQKRFTEAIRHHVSAITFRRLLNVPVAPGQHGEGAPSRAVYISYARDHPGDAGPSRETIVNRIEAALKRNGYDVRRDTTNLGYTGLISAFMREIGRGRCVVSVVSDKYLRSRFCMYELLEVYRNQEFHRRLCPVVLLDAHVRDVIDRSPYGEYWSSQYEQRRQLLRQIDPAYLATEDLEELHRYQNIAQEAGRLIAFIADMNYSTLSKIKKDDFLILRKRIDECLK